MEVAKDEALMPCRAHFAFLNQHCFSVGKAPDFGRLFHIPVPQTCCAPGEDLPLPQGHGPQP